MQCHMHTYVKRTVIIEILCKLKKNKQLGCDHTLDWIYHKLNFFFVAKNHKKKKKNANACSHKLGKCIIVRIVCRITKIKTPAYIA